jgi:galacturan 1,4-alpha-galacturonidase
MWKFCYSFLCLCATITTSAAGASVVSHRSHPNSVIYFPEAATTSVYSVETTIPLHKNSSYPYLGQVAPTSDTVSTKPSGPTCIVIPYGWGRDDSSQILAAVDRCGTNGTIILPAPYVYTISRRMHFKLSRARFEILGTLSFTPDLLYWINNSFRVEFQNQSTAWIVEGHDFTITGGGWGQGGIDGNGQAWMTRAAGQSNQFGRPISLSIYNSSRVTVTDFSIRQPQFWSFWIQDSSQVELNNIYINGTNTDPAGNGSNYETNIDGMDSMRVDNLLVSNWLFHGGDDCLAPKGNSTNMVFRNLTCVGGGIAFGSIGQYKDSPDYITNVTATDISVSQSISPLTGGSTVSGGAYFKSWVGVEEGAPPQGGGGGTGRVSNVSFDGLKTSNTSQAIFINKCYYKVADQAHYCDTSTLEFEDLSFSNVSGTVSGSVGIGLNCSAAAPCRDIRFQDVHLRTAGNSTAMLKCDNVFNVTGVVCNSTLPS